VEVFDGGCLVQLRGPLDETIDAAALRLGAQRCVLVFNLDEVHRVSSFGVRIWIHVVRELTAEYWAVARARPAMLEQLGNIDGILTGGQLLSCYMELHCPRCQAESQRLLDLRASSDLTQARATCTACGKRMEGAELDELVPGWRQYEPRNVPPLVDAMLSGRARREGPAPRPAPGPAGKPFKAKLSNLTGVELGTFECVCAGERELQVRQLASPLPLASQVRVTLFDVSKRDCACTVSAGFSQSASWSSVLVLVHPTPLFLEALDQLSGGRP